METLKLSTVTASPLQKFVMWGMIRLLFSVIGGVILTLGWDVNVETIGLVRFVIVWVLGVSILMDVTPYLEKRLTT